MGLRARSVPTEEEGGVWGVIGNGRQHGVKEESPWVLAFGERKLRGAKRAVEKSDCFAADENRK